ncbi:PAS domain S-box protein [Devosia sp. RR2S18]|uniref:PAS domain-containing hybrid sensor histidine kinase/response regulator n=1 Tax=Devosia rhizosphaerae TaxID=3049774 RepID=UPI002540A75D|nr:PAS domain S-box protein [Devosia sp. RR2S18]WIJ25837.1 PAS domain S-box protein [Devosia sp. RR2S18]
MLTNEDMDESGSSQVELAELQRQIKDARHRLELTLEAAGAAGGWVWDIAARRLTADPRFAALTGQDPLELAQGVPTSKFFTSIHPEDVRRIRLAVAGMLAGAEVFSKDFRLQREDGGIRWVHAHGGTVLNEQDQPIRFHGTLIDVTDRKRTEDQLRVAQTAGEIGTFEHTEGYGTVAVSRQFCRLLGLHPTNVLPVRTINLLVHPEDRPIIDPKLPSKPRSERNIEFRITRADTGETRWLARRGEYQEDMETSGLRYIGVLYDITDSKRIEERLRLSNEALSENVRERTRERNQVWQNSRDLLTVVGVDGVIRDVNPAWHTVLGYEEASLIGRAFVDLANGQERDQAQRLVAFNRSSPPASEEVALVGAGGSLHVFSWDAAAEGELIYLYGHDITAERKQAEILQETEALLRQSQKMEAVGQLTGGIAHDFNNMLTGIIGSLDIMKRRIANKRYDELDKFMSAAITSAQRAASLTHRLLAFSRRQSLDRKPTDVVPLINSIRDLLTRTLGERITLQTVLPESCWRAVTDANQLESALLNLAINARDAMPDGGQLRIEVANVTFAEGITSSVDEVPVGDYLRIAVIDTGEGMPTEVLDKAFDPFFTTKPIGQGTGLGLSMIYGFVRQSGGHVEIASTVGKGTTVSVYLPRDHGAPSITSSPTIERTPLGEGETVLVVEDDPAVRLLVVDVLQELGYLALEAADSDGALPILQSSARLDLLISDVGLPGLNGRQLADLARQSRPELRVLFITGYAAMAASRSDFLGAGMDMITKPFAMDDLATKIRQMLVDP